MEFQKSIEEQKRMCNSFVKCSECPMRTELMRTEFSQKNYANTGLSLKQLCELFIVNNPKTAENVVEKWVKENPVMTNGKKFCEVFGIDLLGVPVFSPHDPRKVLYMRGVPLDEWLQAEYKPQNEVER